MSQRLLREGPGFQILVSDEALTAVPYGPVDHDDGDRNYGFTDLIDRPDLVPLIAEAQKSAGLMALLRTVNSPHSLIMSFGCECSLFEDDDAPPELRWYVGGYVDVTFRDPAKNATSRAMTDLAETILRHLNGPARHHVMFAFVVEPLRDFFGHPDRWGLVVRPLGRGPSPTEAWAAFDHASLMVRTALTQLEA